jgi:hypothetical protein
MQVLILRELGEGRTPLNLRRRARLITKKAAESCRDPGTLLPEKYTTRETTARQDQIRDLSMTANCKFR